MLLRKRVIKSIGEIFDNPEDQFTAAAHTRPFLLATGSA